MKNLTLSECYEDVSFTLAKGQILGITGILGSGRTELALSLFGIKKADSGTVIINGKKVVLDSPSVAMTIRLDMYPKIDLQKGYFSNVVLVIISLYQKSIIWLTNLRFWIKRRSMMRLQSGSKNYLLQRQILITHAIHCQGGISSVLF